MDDNQAMHQAMTNKLGEEIQQNLMLRAKLSQVQKELEDLKKDKSNDTSGS